MSTTRTVMLSVRQEPHRFMLATLGIVQVSIAMGMEWDVNDLTRIQDLGTKRVHILRLEASPARLTQEVTRCRQALPLKADGEFC